MMETRSKKNYQTQWAQQLTEIDKIINILNNVIADRKLCNFLNWSTLLQKFRLLIKNFYGHCLDYVTLSQSKILYVYGNQYNFDHCTLVTVKKFIVDFPTFPSCFEWRHCVAIEKICDCLLVTLLEGKCLCSLCKPIGPEGTP